MYRKRGNVISFWPGFADQRGLTLKYSLHKIPFNDQHVSGSNMVVRSPGFEWTFRSTKSEYSDDVRVNIRMPNEMFRSVGGMVSDWRYHFNCISEITRLDFRVLLNNLSRQGLFIDVILAACSTHALQPKVCFFAVYFFAVYFYAKVV